MNTTYRIPKDKEDQIFKEAIVAARKVKVDELNCDVSIYRKSSEKTVEEALQLRGENSYLTHFIYRDRYFLPQEYPENRNYWDVGFSTIGGGTHYFLWIELEKEEGFKLVEKFQLDIEN